MAEAVFDRSAIRHGSLEAATAQRDFAGIEAYLHRPFEPTAAHRHRLSTNSAVCLGGVLFVTRT